MSLLTADGHASGSVRSAEAWVETRDAGTAGKFPLLLTVTFAFALLALTVLDRFGIRVTAAYSVPPAMVALYAIVVAMILTRSALIDRRGLLLYMAIVITASLSLAVNLSLAQQQVSSTGSLALVMFLYLPFVLVMPATIATPERWLTLMRGFIGFMMLCAVLGIVQFYAQYVIKADWLFDFRAMIPEAIRGSGTYNTTNVVGNKLKANGFFLREASGLSFYTAFALLCEWSLFKRKLHMLVLLVAMLLTYSGSGLLTLAVALLFPLNFRTVTRVVAVAMVGGLVVLLLGDALNLSYTLGRVGELSATATTSSAYCRFIAPGLLVANQIDSDAWSFFLGHGPGTTQKLSSVCETTYGKLVFEYGLIGTILFSWIILRAVNRAGMSIQVRVAFVVMWYLLGGNLVAPEALLLVLMLSSFWPHGTAPQAESLLRLRRETVADSPAGQST